jgi:hypothetical protein
LPVREVYVWRREGAGNITFALRGSGLRKMIVSLRADEFDAAEGKAFVRAVIRARESEEP